MTPPTRLQQLPCLVRSETMDGATFDTAIDPKGFGGVMTPPYESGTKTYNFLIY